MSALDALAPDQRAVVALVLRPGGRYEDVAAVLGIPMAAVRARAHAGLAALAPRNGLPAEITAPLADYLLGQQSEADAAATRGLLEESAPARAWVADVAEALAADAPGGLPEIPGEPVAVTNGTPVAAEDDAPVAAAEDPAPRPADDPPAVADRAPAAPPPASRVGGALLIAGVVAAVALVAFLLLRGGGDDPASPAEPAAVATATPTATASEAQVTDQIDLRAVGGSSASGRMTVFLQDDRLLFQIQAEGVPPSGGRAAYAVWLTGPGTRARRLGYTDPVGEDGVLGIQGPGDADLDAFPRLYATYTHVVVSRETDDAARRPGRPVLRGPLPRGREG